MGDSRVVSLCVVIILLIVAGLIKFRIQQTKQTAVLKYPLPSLDPSIGLKGNLARILSEVQELVSTSAYSIYLYDASEHRYVLHAVRQAVLTTNIAPSYSGLVPYEKQAIKSPVTVNVDQFPSKSMLVKEGNLSFVWIPIEDGVGFIKMGPIKKLLKKEVKLIEDYMSVLAKPLQKLMEDNKDYRKRQNPAKQANRRIEKLRVAENYALYYGHGKVKELSHFDVMIVEAKGFSKQQFQELKSSNKLLVTYISILEVHPTEAIFENLTDQDFLWVDGKRVKNEVFGTYVMNLQSKKWMEYILENVHHLLIDLEADGLFLDTIGNLEWSAIPLSTKQTQLQAFINFLHVLKMLYADQLIIQNNGLETICIETAPYIDGVCWENPPLTMPESKEWNEQIVQHLCWLKEEHHVKVFLLLEETMETLRQAYPLAKKMANEHNFLLYNAPQNYVDTVKLSIS